MTVYTVIINDYDNLRPPEIVERGVDYVCFSDEFHVCPPWRIVPCPRVFLGWQDSRLPKMLPHLWFPHGITIYHDASLRMRAAPSDIIAGDLGDAEMALYRHPCRTSVRAEMECCERESIGYGNEMKLQVERYERFGIKGLFAGGCIVRRNTPNVKRFNEIWWREFNMGCSRDQIALPCAVQKSEVTYNVINADIMQDKRFEITWHARMDHRDNAMFEPERQKRIARRKTLEALCR
jgi:hypothetical protein